MDREASTSHVVLESMLLDESAEPTQLTLSLLEDITNRFSFDLQIGRGGFAVVYKGIVGKGLVAVKKLSNTFCIPEKKFHEEVKCLIKAKHKNIVRFLGYCAETQGKVEEIEGNFVMADQRNWLLCFEYVCNGSLDRHITDATRGLNWRFRYRIIRGICEGLLFLHETHILHLDLKPANILLDAHMVPKIADFGLSRCLGEEQTRAITQNIIGTLGYVDPQYLKTGEMEYASDIYSLGVIIMEILAGVRRYHTDESVVESWINLLRASEGDMQMEQVRVCYNIGIQCMDLDPKKRPVARHIVDMLDKTIDNSDETSIASSLWGGQHMKENINSHRTSNFRSTRKYFEFFIRKARRNFDRNNMLNLEKSYFISIFRKDELEPILRSSNFIGKGAFTEVYKGVIDNTLVAVKKTVNGKVHKNNELKNEVIIQSQISHKNIVLLIGCCLEMDTPVLVYEFLPGGSLHDILHRDSKVPLNLDVRLTIVAESAQGLAYLHSQARTKICHGDVRTESILLDDNLLPKISDFGLSRVIARDSKHAYMDTALSTEKSDVYSFGIVILEVISRKKDTHADDFSLLKSFLEVHKQGKKATNLFDTEISVAGDLELLDCLAEIAMECLNLDVNQRPSMTDVAERLLILSRSHGLHARHTVDKTRRADYSFVTGISSSLAEQDTNLHGTTISSSVSTGLYKFNNLDIFNRKGRRKFDRNVTHTLQKSHFIKIFKKEEIREIIRSSTSIGKGAFSEVYKGVADDALVAVKKMLDSNALKSKRLEDKVIIQSQIIHKNIVRLIGYCLEMDSPVLVYEFLSSGTLHDILHSGSMVPLNLDVRLSMVAESAQGLAYLHSHTHCRILHGDVRPANILLDDNFMPKITIVDASPMEEQEYIQTIRVDLAYMDPVYLQTGILTEESDVYSFGIVILEVISRKFPANNGSLVRSFLGIHKKGKKATELFDKEIAVSGNWEILDCLAEIAVQCLSPDRDERPTMTDVAERLLTLQRYRGSQVVRQ